MLFVDDIVDVIDVFCVKFFKINGLRKDDICYVM